MISAIEKDFDVNTKHIDYGKSCDPNRFIFDNIKKGDDLTLHKKGHGKDIIKVFVKETRNFNSGYVGIICGFSPSDFASKSEGVQIGDEIYFCKDHIFAYGHSSS